MNKNTRILIVEDESLVADDLDQSLRRLGYRTAAIVDTGEEAVAQALDLRPDLVLMDIRLKGKMDGIAAAAQLGAPHYIPVVFLTSYSDCGTLERAGVTAPFGYLTKPFQERDLYTTVETALYRHQAEGRIRNHNDQLSQGISHRTAELQSAQQELKRCNEQLHAAKGQLQDIGYCMSHDLQAPVRAINGFAFLLKENHEHALDDAGRRLLNVIAASSARMGQRIDGFLHLMRLGQCALKPEAVDTAIVVNGIIRELLPTQRLNRVRIEVGALPQAIADRRLFQLIWASLIDNAIKFSACRAEPVVTISGTDTGAEIIYTIRDNGVGFDSNNSTGLFALFQRLHHEEEFPGHGIGLASVQRAVTLLGGRVWAESQPDLGATFYFSLPQLSLSGPLRS